MDIHSSSGFAIDAGKACSVVGGFIFSYWSHGLGPRFLVAAMAFILAVLLFFVFIGPMIWKG